MIAVSWAGPREGEASRLFVICERVRMRQPALRLRGLPKRPMGVAGGEIIEAAIHEPIPADWCYLRQRSRIFGPLRLLHRRSRVAWAATARCGIGRLTWEGPTDRR